MAMNFEELDNLTRREMLAEFELEQSAANAYPGKNLSTAGRAEFPRIMRRAIANGTEITLTVDLTIDNLWLETESYVLKGVRRERKINVQQAAERLAITEFNTWYVRGLSRKLINEGVRECQVYRAAQPKWEPADCSSHEGAVYPVQLIYDGHRAHYWPEPGNSEAISIPFGPGCHHTIRRLA